jgi:pimeloyl-ACP methyl ester carboxylesterase
MPLKLRILIAFFISILTVSACGGPDIAPLIDEPAGGVVITNATYETQECDFERYGSEANFECGVLTAPLDYDNPDGETGKMKVAIIKSSAEEPQPDPVVFILGGPVAMVDSAGGIGSFFSSTLAERDIILYNMRGSADPGTILNCPEYYQRFAEMVVQDLNDEYLQQERLDIFKHCRENLDVQGVRLADYSTVQNVKDLIALRSALEIKKWNIYAADYGTTLALALLQEDPQGIRSLILDSVLPIGTNAYLHAADRFSDALNILFDLCKNDNEECDIKFPDLGKVFYQTVDELNAYPITVTAQDLNTGDRFDVFVDGDRLIDLVLQTFNQPFNNTGLAQIPRMIYQLHNGKQDVIKDFLANIRYQVPENIVLTHITMCNDYFKNVSLQDLTDANGDTPPQLVEYFTRSFRMESAACEIWIDPTYENLTTKAAKSDIPVLFLNGDLNWYSPPEFASIAGKSLSQSTSLTFHGIGVFSVASQMWGNCSKTISDAFLSDPTAEVDPQCSLGEKDIVFITLP